MLKFENKLNGRFYYVEVKKDLFGDLVIHIRRGGDHVVVERLIFCPDDGSLRAQLRQISERRFARGYTLTE